tara:strand:+ start:1854 stop:2081 length:228 start_codon:yes stop_codon:yes gene_type:complete
MSATDRKELICSLAQIAGMQIEEVEYTLKELERGGFIDMDRTGERTPVIRLSKEAREHAEQLIQPGVDGNLGEAS